MEDAVHCFSLTGPDTSFSNNLHLHFTLAVAPIATTRPCHLLELLHFWNPELWNSPFWPQPLILLSVPSLSCPWNMFFGLIGTLGLLTFPYVSSISLPSNSIPIPTLFVQPFQLYSHNYVQLSHSFDFLFYLSFQSLGNNFSLLSLSALSTPCPLFLSPSPHLPFPFSLLPPSLPSLFIHSLSISYFVVVIVVLGFIEKEFPNQDDLSH